MGEREGEREEERERRREVGIVREPNCAGAAAGIGKGGKRADASRNRICRH